MRDDLRKEKAELEKTLEIKKMELSVEKENEGSIGKHQADLTSRLQELNQEVMILEQKQKAVSFFKGFKLSIPPCSNFYVLFVVVEKVE